MIQATNRIALQILRPSPERSGLTLQIALNHQSIGPPRLIEEASLSTLRHVADGCRQLQKKPNTPTMATEVAIAVGIESFFLWLAPDWETLEKQLIPGKPTLLTITSNVAEILHFPWEAITLPNGITLGTHPQFSVQRRPYGIPTKDRCRAHTPGPLRILFMAASPQGFHAPLAHQERERFKSMLSPPEDYTEPAINLLITPTASPSTLATTIYQYQPHVVHLAGAGLINGTQGFFAFEEEGGQADVRTAAEISRELLTHSGVGLLVISGRELNKAPPIAANGQLCQEIVATHGVPMALSWPESLSAPESQPFLHTFYKQLATGIPIDQALNQARATLMNQTPTTGHLGWLLAALYASGEQSYLFTRTFC